MTWLALVSSVCWLVVGWFAWSERRAIRRAGNEPRPLREAVKDTPWVLLTYFLIFGLPILVAWRRTSSSTWT